MAEKTVQLYDITIAGINIGELKATRITDGEKETYEIHSLVSFWFFGELKIEFLLNSLYQNGELISSNTTSSTNRGDFLSLISRDGNQYIVDANSYKFTNQEPVSGPINFTSALLFFEEPEEGKRLLSENYGLTCEVKKVKDGSYQVDINENQNKYYYEDGELEKVLMEFPIKNYVIKRRK